MNAHERGAVVQRSKLRQLVDLRDHLVVNEDGPVEVLPALHDAMPNGVDFRKGIDGLGRSLGQRFEHQRHRVVMIGHFRIDDLLVLVKTMLVKSLGGTHALADALRQKLMLLNVDQLVLQGR